jgi:HPt (histidine-containing phosphotransfer) domain-containing protein
MTAHAMKGDRERCLAAGMDSYISKPVKAKDLFDIIDELMMQYQVTELTSHNDISQGAGMNAGLSVIDMEEALSRVEGDQGLLHELAQLFIEDYAELLNQVRTAVENHDSEALTHTAHTFKGSVGNFGAKAAFEAALKLEMMGRNDDLEGAKAAFKDLEKEVERVLPVLASLHVEEVV